MGDLTRMTTRTAPQLERQPFEEAFLGAPVFRVAAADNLTARAIAEIETQARSEGAKLVVVRVTDDKASIFDGTGFRRVETLVTYRRVIASSEAVTPSHAVRQAGAEDWPGAVEIARTAFTHDRIHLDPAIRHIADDSKAQWARNDLEGRADANFVTGDEGSPTGFNLCLLRDQTAVIDLIAVAEGHRGEGIARALVRAAIQHYAGRAAEFIVGTQEANTSATGLYVSEGFELIRREATFHLTPDPEVGS
jgi:ribosomal protein S18 acetylase RimI-like enzyme